MRAHVIGLWIFTVAIIGFLGGMLWLTAQGDFLGVQRLGSIMVFAGTLSAFELINDRRQLATAREQARYTRIRSQLADTRRWIFALQDALKRLDLHQEMKLDSAIDAKREVDATFARLSKKLEESERDSAEDLETVDLHAALNTMFLVGGGTLVWGYGDLAAAWLAKVLF